MWPNWTTEGHFFGWQHCLRHTSLRIKQLSKTCFAPPGWRRQYLHNSSNFSKIFSLKKFLFVILAFIIIVFQQDNDSKTSNLVSEWVKQISKWPNLTLICELLLKTRFNLQNQPIYRNSTYSSKKISKIFIQNRVKILLMVTKITWLISDLPRDITKLLV